MTEPKITFATQDGRELLLEGVHYEVAIDGLMAATTIEQNYSNPYNTNIEAVYTFPLTPDAVLLGIEIRINERVLKGTIIEKSEAEAQYEEAVDEGNRAIMVEKDSDGIYTVNIANLLPDDKISVSIQYTQLLEWRQDQVKWSLPTTIAQKYGNPSGLGLDDVTDPAISLWAENLFGLSMTIRGVLADSRINAPSHVINIDKYEDHTQVTLKNEKDFMDKDIVFTFKTQKSREERSFALVGKDFDGYAAIASFYPSFGAGLPREPKSVTFVIDCSGSMSGVSIDRAKTALHKALDLFTEEDSFNIVSFGSHHSSLFDREVPATQKNINTAKRMVRSLDANMGGTEMAGALQAAYAGHSTAKEKKGYLFLITDGEIYDHYRVIENARKSEMAHYVVGVGYASDDALLKKLAIQTRGSYEGIDPNEKMDDYILNLFKKIDTPKAIDIKVKWPFTPKTEHSPGVVFDGDTLYAYAAFDTIPAGEAVLSYTLENGSRYRETVEIGQHQIGDENTPSVVSRIVIAKEIDELNANRHRESYYRLDAESEEGKEIIRYSTKYQLFSELTNYILVDEVAQSEKPVDLPRMHRVENMVAENANMYNVSSPGPSFEYSKSIKMMASYGTEEDSALEVSTFLRQETDHDTGTDSKSDFDAMFRNDDIDEIMDAIDPKEYDRSLQLFDHWFRIHRRLPGKKRELQEMGLADDIISMMESRSLREQIRLLVLELYSNAPNAYLSDEFRAYIVKMQSKLSDKIQ